MRTCALIPAHDEGDVIGGVVSAVRNHVDHVIVVDDGSSDGTARLVRQAGGECVSLPRRGGKGRAVRAGLARIAGSGFTHVLFMDGDGQHLPAEAPLLIEAARLTGADLVIGARPFDRARMPRSRHFSNTFGSWLASQLIGRRVRDSQSGFRVARLDALSPICLRARGYEFEMEVLIKMSRAGGRIAETPVTMVYNGGVPRSKMRPIRDSIRVVLWALAFRFLGA